jgi:hypothetical protein
LTLDTAKAEISRCQNQFLQTKIEHQRIVDEFRKEELEHQRRINAEILLEWIIGIVSGIVSLALTIRYRARIGGGLYNVFVGCLALRLRFNRSRKRFLDSAIKEAENRLG